MLTLQARLYLCLDLCLYFCLDFAPDHSRVWAGRWRRCGLCFGGDGFHGGRIALQAGLHCFHALGNLFGFAVYGLRVGRNSALRGFHELFHLGLKPGLLARDGVLLFRHGLKNLARVADEFDRFVHGDNPLAHRQQHLVGFGDALLQAN